MFCSRRELLATTYTRLSSQATPAGKQIAFYCSNKLIPLLFILGNDHAAGCLLTGMVDQGGESARLGHLQNGAEYTILPLEMKGRRNANKATERDSAAFWQSWTLHCEHWEIGQENIKCIFLPPQEQVEWFCFSVKEKEVLSLEVWDGWKDGQGNLFSLVNPLLPVVTGHLILSGKLQISYFPPAVGLGHRTLQNGPLHSCEHLTSSCFERTK